MKRNLSLQNWTKRVFPLYKNLIGITKDDRIIGIDPDIIRGILLYPKWQIRDGQDQRITLAYGVASMRGTYGGHTPIPVKLTLACVEKK